MRLVPFVRFKYETEISEATILDRLQQNTLNKDWGITFDKIVNNKILEGDFSKSSFVVVAGKFGLTYGRFSLLPVMYGKTMHDEKISKSVIKIMIRPFTKGLFILFFFYLLVLIGIVTAIQKNDIKMFSFMCLFIGVTYISLLIRYNSGLVTYVDLIENKILLNDFVKKN